MSLERGFNGTEDLYGLGIRIGYYTAATSLWISNLWAPAESYFLRPITLIFLLAVLIGVSVLSINPEETFAIEPFMMMQIAYYTYFMSMGGPKPFDLLAWEENYFHFFMMKAIGLGLHGFDTWFWFSGLYRMKPTPGVRTNGILIYFGQVDIFGWITYVARCYVVGMIGWHIWSLVTSLCQRGFEKELDHDIPPSRLQQISEKWVTEFDSLTRSSLGQDGLRQRGLLSPPCISRHASMSSVKSAPINTLPLGKALEKDTSLLNTVSSHCIPDLHSFKSTIHPETEALPSRPLSSRLELLQQDIFIEQRVKRTGTDRFRGLFLGWHQESRYGAEYISDYTPTLQSLADATSLLESTNMPGRSNQSWWILVTWYYIIPREVWRFLISLFTHRLKPRVLFAVLIHSRTLCYTQEQFKITMWRLAMSHPAYNTIAAADIGLASRIMLTLRPLRRPRKAEILSWAWATATTCVLLMIGTELAIQWNEIRGVQNIRTVGQLIPAAIGVGGLFKVVWSAVFEQTEVIRLCFGRCKGDIERAEWAEACEVYERANNTWQRRKEGDGGDEKKNNDSAVKHDDGAL